MTAPDSGDQNEYYRQQESRAERTREEARALRGDDPEEPTELPPSEHEASSASEEDGGAEG